MSVLQVQVQPAEQPGVALQQPAAAARPPLGLQLAHLHDGQHAAQPEVQIIRGPRVGAPAETGVHQVHNETKISITLQKIFHLKNIFLKVLKIFDVIRYRSIKKKSGGPVPESKDLVKPVTMRPRLATVSSDTDGDEVTDGRNSGSGHSLEQSSWEVGPCSEEASTTNPGPRAAASPAQPRMTQADRPLTSTNTNTRPHGLAGDRASVSTNTVSGAEPLTSNSSMRTRDVLTSTTIPPSLSPVAVLSVHGAPAQPQPGL